MPCKYADVGHFEDGFAWVGSNVICGCVDTSGKLVVDVKYRTISVYANLGYITGKFYYNDGSSGLDYYDFDGNYLGTKDI